MTLVIGDGDINGERSFVEFYFIFFFTKMTVIWSCNWFL